MTLTELKKMNKTELRQLKSQIDFLLQDKKEYENDSKLLYEKIRSVINSILKCEAVPEYYIMKSKKKDDSMKELLTATEFLNKLLDSWYPNHTLLEKVQFYNVFAKLVSLYIETETNVPLSFGTVIRFHTFFPSLFDNTYPGYIQNDAISFVLK